jgi:hypothetical protein
VIGLQRELEGLPGLWEAGLGDAYETYLAAASRSLDRKDLAETAALAAGLVEVALDLQRLGKPPPPPVELLRADLCLARASRLLAETRHRGLQIAFARAIEEQAAAAGDGVPAAPTRDRLLAALASGAAA